MAEIAKQLEFLEERSGDGRTLINGEVNIRNKNKNGEAQKIGGQTVRKQRGYQNGIKISSGKRNF